MAWVVFPCQTRPTLGKTRQYPTQTVHSGICNFLNNVKTHFRGIKPRACGVVAEKRRRETILLEKPAPGSTSLVVILQRPHQAFHKALADFTAQRIVLLPSLLSHIASKLSGVVAFFPAGFTETDLVTLGRCFAEHLLVSPFSFQLLISKRRREWVQDNVT